MIYYHLDVVLLLISWLLNNLINVLKNLSDIEVMIATSSGSRFTIKLNHIFLASGYLM